MKLAVIALLAFLAGAALSRQFVGEAHAQEVEALKADNRALAGQIGASCEPIYGVWWVENACPGVAGGFIPQSLRPLACPSVIRVYRSAAPGPVLQKVSAFLPGSAVLVLEEKGVKERVLPLTWKPEIKP